MPAPDKPSELKGQVYLRFVDPQDDSKVIQVGLIDTGLTAPDTTKIYALSTAGATGPVPVIPPSLVPNPPIVLAGGVAEQLPALALLNGIAMKSAGGNNAAGVWIGADNTVAPNNGYLLLPGSGVPIEVQNMNQIWVYGTAGDILYYLGG